MERREMAKWMLKYFNIKPFVRLSFLMGIFGEYLWSYVMNINEVKSWILIKLVWIKSDKQLYFAKHHNVFIIIINVSKELLSLN